MYGFYSDLFGHVQLPPCHIKDNDCDDLLLLSSEFELVKNCTAPRSNKTRPEHLDNLPLALVNTVARLPTRNLSGRQVPKQWKTIRTLLPYKKEDPRDLDNYRAACLQ